MTEPGESHEMNPLISLATNLVAMAAASAAIVCLNRRHLTTLFQTLHADLDMKFTELQTKLDEVETSATNAFEAMSKILDGGSNGPSQADLDAANARANAAEGKLADAGSDTDRETMGTQLDRLNSQFTTFADSVNGIPGSTGSTGTGTDTGTSTGTGTDVGSQAAAPFIP